MSKEYHVFTHHGVDFEQALVFEVIRHMDKQQVEFHDLYMIVSRPEGELRTRVEFGNMIDTIIDNVGGNVEDKSINVILDIFKDIIPIDKMKTIENEILDREISNIDPNELIKVYEDSMGQINENN